MHSLTIHSEEQISVTVTATSHNVLVPKGASHKGGTGAHVAIEETAIITVKTVGAMNQLACYII